MDNLPVVYLDEIVFSKRTIQSKALSLRNQYIKVDQNNLYIGYLAVIAAVSATKGVVHVRVEH